MFEKVYFGGTYAYKDFITDDEQIELTNWVLSEQTAMSFSEPVNSEEDQYKVGLKRHFRILYPNDEKPNIFYKIRNKILKLENITNPIPAPINYDWIGIVGEDSYVEPHLDESYREYYTVRYNLLISFPDGGGRPIYGGKLLPVEEKMLWRCDAGIVEHSSEVVKGDKLRINLSYGFSFEL
jgi:hypothetical protein